MPRRLLLVVALMLVISVSAFGGETLTLPQYVSRLDELAAATEDLTQHPDRAAELLHTVPESWTVNADGQTYTVSATWLRDALASGKSESFQAARQHLLTLRSEATGYDRQLFDAAAMRAKANDILARREFRNVRGPSWWDRLKRRALEWVLKVISRIFGSSAVPAISRILVWVLVAAALVVAVVMITRTIRRTARFESIMPEDLPVSAKEYSVWMAEARAAAAQGRWRDAIHLAYWGGISFLEAQGMWRPDRARTPREYLRLLSPPSAQSPALMALTRRFEIVWYGYAPADEQGYVETLAELEKLGCR